MDKLKLLEECQRMQSFLEVDLSEDINEAVERGNQLNVYMARSGNMLAIAKQFKDKRKRESILSKLGVKLPTTTLNDLIDSECEEENFLVNWLDRINRTCTHQQSWCITIISKAKEEMKLSQWGNLRT